MPVSRSKKISALIVGHGSRVEGFEEPMERVARQLKKTAGFSQVVCAYLEISKPSVREAIDDAVAAGADEVRVLPYFLLKGRHTLQDIPAIVKEAREHYRGKARVSMCPYIGYDVRLAQVAARRLRQTERLLS